MNRMAKQFNGFALSTASRQHIHQLFAALTRSVIFAPEIAALALIVQNRALLVVGNGPMASEKELNLAFC